jgi:hypothetical protein
MGQPANFLDYVKAAFLWHWHLLALGAGVVFGLLSGQPDVVLPLIAAAELTYLGVAASNRRLQKVVAARLAAPVAEPGTQQAAQLQKIRAALCPEDVERFEALRSRCLELHALAEQLRGASETGGEVLTQLRTDSLDRLLWVFLKLLYSKDALDRFLHGTDRNGLLREKAQSEKTLDVAKKAGRSEELLRSLQDKLDTVNQRLANLDRAGESRDLIAAEVDRIEQKISAIGEMSVGTRSATDISAQVDSIAAGVSVTQQALRDFDVIPTLSDESAPPLLQR